VRGSDIDPELADEDEDGIDEQACVEIVDEAQQLIDASMTCGEDAACGLAAGHELVADPCLPILSCWVPTSTHANLDRVSEELIELDKRYRDECGLCPTAMCIDESQITASCGGNHCELHEHRPWPDDLAAPAPGPGPGQVD
jgi:hypothetical protein